MDEYTGWLLDLYAQSHVGVVLWILSETGERLRATKPFPVTFYAAGEDHQLRTLWRYLVSQPAPV